MPLITYDGDFTVAQLAGPPVYEIPFPTDPKPYAYKLPYWQFLESYTELALGTAGPIGGTYVGGTPGSFKGIGGGVIEFWREYALVPDTRNDFESFNYSYQIALSAAENFGVGGGQQAAIYEFPTTVNCRLQFDYFRTDDPQRDIVLDKAPRALLIGTQLFYLHGYNVLAAEAHTDANIEFLAENATMRCWKGNIYERKQRLILFEKNYGSGL